MSKPEPDAAVMLGWLATAARRVPTCFTAKEKALLGQLTHKDRDPATKLTMNQIGEIQTMWRTRQPPAAAS